LDMLKHELISIRTETDKRNGLKEIKLYCHASIDTDLSVHLYWEGGDADIHGSALALRLASALEEFGRVNHTVWIEDQTK
ncbi:MAG: hypothetical protein JRI94_14910, partial [Deltaproteobacteria bacterium]|nr:hypothetical protein [Deltaproteobacteria bacterium]